MAVLEQRTVDEVLVLRLRGALDHHGVEEVGTEFADAAASASRVVVDLGSLELMNTPGIAMLLGSHRILQKKGGRLVLSGASGIVADLIRRCRLDAVLTLAPTEAEAVEWAKKPG
jgi:anti-sigma B factor antagonist